MRRLCLLALFGNGISPTDDHGSWVEVKLDQLGICDA